MNKNEFNGIAARLRREIDYEISYVYGAFVPREEHSILSKMKSIINLQDKDFLEKDITGAIFPYDILRHNLSKCIENFYDEFSLSVATLYKLSTYGTKAEILKKQFIEKLDTSKNRMKKEVLKGIESQIIQNKDAATLMRHIHKILDKSVASLEKLLLEHAGQMNRYMLLWDYENNGYRHYRLMTQGNNCENCTALNSEVYEIDKAVEGKNFPPLHPNCDCLVEVLDNEGNVVFVIEDKQKQDVEHNTDDLNYLGVSLKQIVLGNYTHDVTILGTLGQILLGLIGVDLPSDIRDLIYDVTHWENTNGHYLQTLLDTVALLPVIGSLKYTDEGVAIAKGITKNTDNIADVTKHIDEIIESSESLRPKKLIDELLQSGEKYALKEVVAITKTSEGKLVWLEKGNSNSGLIHIFERHINEFNSEGITDIPDFLVKLLNSKPIKQGSNAKGLYGDYLFDEKAYRVAYGTNGYIVTVYPID